MDATERQELTDFRAYDEQLGEQLTGLARLRHQVRFFPLFALVTGVPLAIFTRFLYGLALVVVWLIFWASTLYITAMRSWHYAAERKRIHREVVRLEAEATAAGHPEATTD